MGVGRTDCVLDTPTCACQGVHACLAQAWSCGRPVKLVPGFVSSCQSCYPRFPVIMISPSKVFCHCMLLLLSKL